MGNYVVRALNKSGTMCIILPKDSGFKIGDIVPIADGTKTSRALTESEVRFIARDEAEKAIEEARR